MSIKVCFLGGARYSRPLDPTSEKKFSSMKSLGEIFVIGFSAEFRTPMVYRARKVLSSAHTASCGV